VAAGALFLAATLTVTTVPPTSAGILSFRGPHDVPRDSGASKPSQQEAESLSVDPPTEYDAGAPPSDTAIDATGSEVDTTDENASRDSFADLWAPVRTAREDLVERGINLKFFFNDEYQAVLRGGRDTNSGRNAASTDIFFIFDLEQLDLLDRSEFLIHFQANWGAGVNPASGTLSEVSDDDDGSIGGHIAQAWYRIYSPDGKISLKIGYLDYQTIVDRNEFANSEDIEFWNQSLDNNPLVPLNIGLGAALTVHPTDWYTFILGAGDARNRPYSAGFDTTFDSDAIFVAYLENGFHVNFPSDRGPLAGNYRVGLFYDPRPRFEFDGGDGTAQTGDWGVYVSADQVLFRESDRDDQGLGVFFRFAYRDPEVNRLSTFWSGGLHYQGLLRGRDDDVLGLGYSFVRSGSEYRDFVNPNFTDETVYELYYAIKVGPNVVITPDIQYVDNPGAGEAFRDLVVAGVRVRLSL